jgi:hypothetical protein
MRRDGWMSFRTPAQQHLADQTSFFEQKAEMVQMRRMIQLMLDKQNGMTQESQQNRQATQLKEGEVQRQQYELDKAKKLAQRYQCSIDIPVIRPPPPGYYRRDDFLSVKNIKMGISVFNPGDAHPKSFHDVWESVTQYGEGEYLQEQDYLRILGFALQGDALRSFKDLRAAGNTFTYIVETLAEIYATKKTLLEDQKAVDDFTRLKNEDIQTAMKRCGLMVERLRPMYDEPAWPEMRFRLMRGVLKQVLSEKTRRHVDLLEKSSLKIGNRMALMDLIDSAKAYEESHDEVPKKDCPTMFQTASGEPKSWLIEAAEAQKQVLHLKQQQHQNKSLEKKIDDVYQMAAAAMKRNSSLERRIKDPLHQLQKKSKEHKERSSSSSSSHAPLPDSDVEMKNAVPQRPQRSTFSFPKQSDNRNRADKPQERGRSKERSSTSGRSSTPYKSANGRSGSQGSQGRGSQHGSRSGSQGSNRGTSKERAPLSQIFRGTLPAGIPIYENRGVQYWMCYSCPSFYKPDELCIHVKPQTEN